jgi:hypothetical protein
MDVVSIVCDNLNATSFEDLLLLHNLISIHKSFDKNHAAHILDKYKPTFKALTEKFAKRITKTSKWGLVYNGRCITHDEIKSHSWLISQTVLTSCVESRYQDPVRVLSEFLQRHQRVMLRVNDEKKYFAYRKLQGLADYFVHARRVRKIYLYRCYASETSVIELYLMLKTKVNIEVYG